MQFMKGVRATLDWRRRLTIPSPRRILPKAITRCGSLVRDALIEREVEEFF